MLESTKVSESFSLKNIYLLQTYLFSIFDIIPHNLTKVHLGIGLLFFGKVTVGDA